MVAVLGVRTMGEVGRAMREGSLRGSTAAGRQEEQRL